MDYAEGLLKVRKNVVDVLDSHTDPDHLRRYTSPLLLFRGHLAMGGGGWVAGQGLRVSQIDQPGN
jgi:hypothetical protein